MAHMSIDMMVCVGTMEFSGHICVFFFGRGSVLSNVWE